MRPYIDDATKRRLFALARDVDDDLPDGRAASFADALGSVLDYAEEQQRDDGDGDAEELADTLGLSEQSPFADRGSRTVGGSGRQWGGNNNFMG